MFDPNRPKTDSPADDTPVSPPQTFVRIHGLLGTMLCGGGAFGMMYGWVFAHQATPAEGQGLMAGLLGGLIASLGNVFATMGWSLLSLGLPIAAAAWGWRKQASWARPLTQCLGVAAACFGIWLAMGGRYEVSFFPFAYAVWVGWSLGRRR